MKLLELFHGGDSERRRMRQKLGFIKRNFSSGACCSIAILLCITQSTFRTAIDPAYVGLQPHLASNVSAKNLFGLSLEELTYDRLRFSRINSVVRTSWWLRSPWIPNRDGVTNKLLGRRWWRCPLFSNVTPPFEVCVYHSVCSRNIKTVSAP